jgi:hypothetical protein
VVDRLDELYWELQSGDEPIGLEEFTARAAAGEYGPVSRGELCGFLRAVEARLVRQLERADPGAHAAATPEELVEETRDWIAELIGRYCES